MKRRHALIDTVMPWTGLVFGILGAGFVHQYGSEGVFDHCNLASPGPLLIAAVLGLLVCLAAGFVSWRSFRRSDNDARRVVGAISAGSAALFCLAILLPMIAALLLPPCFQ